MQLIDHSVEPRGGLSFLFRQSNSGSLKNHSFIASGSRQNPLRSHGRPSGKSTLCGLNGLRPTLRVGELHFLSATAFRALAPAASFRRVILLCFVSAKNMAHPIFQLERELQNIPEAAPDAMRSFSFSERITRYGSSAISGVEHLPSLSGKSPSPLIAVALGHQ